jgi:hypothetical protein
MQVTACTGFSITILNEGHADSGNRNLLLLRVNS